MPLRGVSHGAGGDWWGWLVGCPLDDLTIFLFFWCRFLFFILINVDHVEQCYPERNIDIRRVALDEAASDWMARETKLHRLKKEYAAWKGGKGGKGGSGQTKKGEGGTVEEKKRAQVPMVCESCWAEYGRRTFIETYDERNDHMKTLELKRQAARPGRGASDNDIVMGITARY